MKKYNCLLFLIFFLSYSTAQNIDELKRQLRNEDSPCRILSLTVELVKTQPNSEFTDSLLRVNNSFIEKCHDKKRTIPYIMNHLRRNLSNYSPELLFNEYEKLIKDAISTNSSEYLLKTLINYSVALSKYGLNEKAIEVLQKEEFSETLLSKYPKIFAARQFYLGKFFYHQSNYAKSLHEYRKGEMICLQYEENVVLLGIYNNISLLFRQINDYATSKDYLFKSLQLTDSISNDIPTLYYNLGVRYRELGILDSALIFINKSINSNKGSNAKNYSELSTIYEAKGQPDLALEYLMKDEVLKYQTKTREELDNRKGKLGAIAFSKKDYPKAKLLYKEAINISENSDGNENDYDNRRQYYQGYFLSMWMEKNQFELVKLFEKYIQIFETLIQRNIENEVSRSEIVHQTKSKEQEIIALEQENELRKSREILFWLSVTLLAALLYVAYRSYRREKRAKKTIEDLRRAEHHSTQNNYDRVLTELKSQINSTENTREKTALKKGLSLIQTSAVLHNMTRKEDTETSGQKNVLLTPHFLELCDKLKVIFFPNGDCKVAISCGDSISIATKSVKPLFFIIEELFTNSWKHAFHNQPNPKISISLQKVSESHLRLSYSDNGTGLPKHVSFDKGEKEGLEIIRSFTKNIGGKIEYGRGEGLSLQLDFEKKIF